MNQPKTIQELANKLGVSVSTINRRKKEPGAPKTLCHVAWEVFMPKAEKKRGRRPGVATETAQELRDSLIREQARKERAIASLRELELEIKEKSLMPESTIAETIAKICTPLRRLLDALPRAAAAAANPSKPMVAERAIRNALDERVFGELQKVMESIGIDDPAQD